MSDERCILCEGELDGVLFGPLRDRLGLLNGEWNFRRCRNCGSGVLHPMPSQEQLLAAYPEVYAVDQAPQTHWLHRLLYKVETQWFYQSLYRASVHQVMRVTGLRGGRMLDVGGGTGRRTVFFQKAGFEAWVLEPDGRPLEVAREKFHLGTIHGTLEDVNWPPESFDLITFFAVIEHLPDPQRTLQAATRLLRPGGWVVALVPVLNSGAARIFRSQWHEAREAPRHVSLPTTMGMHALFSRSGLDLKVWKADHIINRAGVMALSLVYSAKSDIACASTAVLPRLVWRATGALAMIACIPLALLEGALGTPGVGVFFAQKPLF